MIVSKGSNTRQATSPVFQSPTVLKPRGQNDVETTLIDWCSFNVCKITLIRRQYCVRHVATLLRPKHNVATMSCALKSKPKAMTSCVGQWSWQLLTMTFKRPTCITYVNVSLKFTDRSRKASFFKSENNGIDSLNSFIFSSTTWHSGNAFTWRGSLLSSLVKPSIPSDKTFTSRFAHSVFAHSSRAA